MLQLIKWQILLELGDLLAGLCSNIKYILKPIVAEAMTLRRAMDFRIELGMSGVILEGDSQIVVNNTNSLKDRETVWYCGC